MVNCSYYYNNVDLYEYSVTLFVGNVKDNTIEIITSPWIETATISRSNVEMQNTLPTLTLHSEGDVLMATFATASDGEAITLYDTTGRAVAVQAVREGAISATIDIAALPQGVYITRMNSGASCKVVL